MDTIHTVNGAVALMLLYAHPLPLMSHFMPGVQILMNKKCIKKPSCKVHNSDPNMLFSTVLYRRTMSFGGNVVMSLTSLIIFSYMITKDTITAKLHIHMCCI